MYPGRRSYTEDTSHERDYRHIKKGTYGRGLRIEGTLRREHTGRTKYGKGYKGKGVDLRGLVY